MLIVESEHDDLVPHPVIQNYKTALAQAQSVTYRVISGADHGLACSLTATDTRGRRRRTIHPFPEAP